ncbi:hypothetical protein RM697_09400 [Ichthyenterobacterium sp. W332]|uniref:Uncharacterized protein n=1 Tax=Microcosmobacter mediterraneus TaxID=3075607 RepID=A0ABU2YL26_9FLAO|nr:hypothetical protein [Ichthyenterobacterium sp. W332]MDT0558864.1 hypothetical protein [Ichthyenterobacterium sp. W332]
MRFTITLCFLFLSLGLFAQIDSKKKKSIRIPAREVKEKKDSTKSDLKKEVKDKTGGKVGVNKIDNINFKKTTIDFNKNKKEFSMFDSNRLKHSGELFQKNLDKQTADVEAIVHTLSDQFLGEYDVKVEFVNIICRDYGAEDGDYIKILLNENTVIPRIRLSNNFRRVKIDLVDGENVLDFKALNQGSQGANTAYFEVYDDNGKLISSKEWALMTGQKATVIFRNQKPTSD